MSVEGEIFERGKAHTGLSNIVSDRIFPYSLPQNESFPVVTYINVSGENPARASGTDHNLRQDRFQIDGWTFDPLEAKNLQQEIENAYNRWSADGSNAGTVVQQSFLESRQVFAEEQEDRRVYHVSCDFQIWYEV